LGGFADTLKKETANLAATQRQAQEKAGYYRLRTLQVALSATTISRPVCQQGMAVPRPCNNSVAAEAVRLATLDHRGGAGSTAKLVLSVRLQQLIVERLYQVGK
jgi:hypothetical protein